METLRKQSEICEYPISSINEEEDNHIIDSDLMCQCGCMLFYIRFDEEEGILAVCPGCGESCKID